MLVFQNLIVLFTVPPPDARRLLSSGDHANALMAAWWSVSENQGLLVDDVVTSQRHNLSSLPPLARVVPSGLHAKPQASCE